MSNSPKGRDIEWISGNASDIETRGTQIESLGDQMVGSAGVLEAVADGAAGMDGLSVEKLREVVGDVYEELKLAGERYSPTGVALKTYGEALGDVQTGLQTIVDNCETYWQNYLGKDSAYDTANTPYPTGAPGSEPPTQAQLDAHDEGISSAHDDREAAYDIWHQEAVAYDAKYDTWETAFENATSAIGEATDGGISDDWTDDLGGFIEVALQVLQYVGLVLAVLALIVGGPLIAILGTIVAVLTLIGTVYLMFKGRKNGADLAWAIVGVIPFSKLGALKVIPEEGMAAGFKAFGRGAAQLDDFADMKGIFSGTGNWADAFGSLRPGDMFGRYMGVKTFADLSDTSQGWDILAGHLDVNIKTTVANIVAIPGMAGQGQTDRSTVDSWQEQLAAS